MDKLNLLLAIHCHQPVGNFGIVFSKAYETAYLPFIEELVRHPSIKISLHYSGSLLDWLKLTHPEFLKRIRHLVKIGQVEILAGGYYEPILTLIPRSDAQAQIEISKESIKDLFSWQSDGCWLTERIWEPKLPSVLNKAGIKWTIIDDSHFASAGLNSENLRGYYISEEEAESLVIFPASEKLRYLIPFKLPQETIAYFKNLSETHEARYICFADDGEKFGLWPGTSKWVYEQKWLENFFTSLEENSSWLETKSFSQYLKEYSPAGRIYLNCASYREMMEWSGGYFRNFLLKYEEANWMHKRMLNVSGQLRQRLNKNKKFSIARQKFRKAQRHLFMAQSNDAYWHGVFGGLYLNHLRSSIYSHLIEAEKLINNSGGHNLDVLDLDQDGHKEIILSSGFLSCAFAPHRGGALLELDFKPKSINMINTLMRRKETYHQKLQQDLINAPASANQPQSIHDLDKIKQAGLQEFLFYDLFPRYCCLDHFLDKQTYLEQFFRCEYEELGDFTQGQYQFGLKNRSKNKACFELLRRGEVRAHPVKIIKRVSLSNNELALIYTIKNESSDYLRELFGIEFNLSVYDHRLSIAPGEVKTDFLNLARRPNHRSRTKTCHGLKVNDIWNNVFLEFSVGLPASVWHFPVETVSNSDTGIEKTYQELCLLFNWPLNIAPYQNWSIRLVLQIQ